MSNMNLSKEELQFIDTYLKNSSVIYTDVRLELTDHIASAIEEELEENSNETFYEVFKSYMISNKKSLLKNHEEQKDKIRRKIILRFGKGFLAKEVLFLIVLAMLVPGFIELKLSEDVQLGVNFALCLLVMLYYHVQFYKTKKTSVGAGLGFIMAYAIYLPIYVKNPMVLLFLIPVMVFATLLYKKIERRVSEGWSMVFVGLFTMVCIPLFVWFTKWSEQFITKNIVEGYFFFQIIMWYVLYKTLLVYKKELDIKYKGIFN